MVLWQISVGLLLFLVGSIFGNWLVVVVAKLWSWVVAGWLSSSFSCGGCKRDRNRGREERQRLEGREK